MHPLRPTPHGVGAIPTPLSLTPLYLTPVIVPRIRFSRSRTLPAWVRVRKGLLAAASVPLLLALAAATVERTRDRTRAALERSAMGEAEMVAAGLVRPLRESGYAPSVDGLQALATRVARVSSITSTHDTRIDARVVAPGVVEIVTRARVANGTATVVCLAALRWEAAALPPSSFGPRCGVQSI